MKDLNIYIAIVDTLIERTIGELINDAGSRNLLVSYAFGDKIIREWDGAVKSAVEPEISLIIDSGAFSAWTSGLIIDIQAYARFCMSIIDKYEFRSIYPVNLDKIPSRPGQAPTLAQVEDSAEVGIANARILRDAGLEPIEVFHQGEPIKFLHKMVDNERARGVYIGLSPANDVGTKGRRVWLDEVFSLLNTKYVSVDTHGFGVTSFDLVKDYPWTTVDSAAYRIAAGYGTVYIFDDFRGEMISLKVGTSVGSMDVRRKVIRDWERLVRLFPVCIQKFEDLNAECTRRIANAYAFKKMQDWVNKRRRTDLGLLYNNQLNINEV